MLVFLKKNKVLLTILTITCLAAIYLLVMIYGGYSRVNQAIAVINADQEKVTGINRKKNPNPVQASADKIKEDTIIFQEKIMELQRHFGRPYRTSLITFVANLRSKDPLKLPPEYEKLLLTEPKPKFVVSKAEKEEKTEKEGSVDKPKVVIPKNVIITTTENELLAKFQQVYIAFSEKEGNETSDNIIEKRERLYQAFRKEMIKPPETLELNEEESKQYLRNSAEKFDRALFLFEIDIKRETFEKFIRDKQTKRYDIHHALMEAMGLPRTMNPFECKIYIDSMNEAIEQAKIIPGIEYGSSPKSFESVKKFTYDSGGKPPALDMIIPILRHFRIVEDLFHRMDRAKISDLKTLVVSGSYYGEPVANGDFLKFGYTLKISSSMPSIRLFLNLLHDAYKQNRVYLVKSVVLTSDVSEIRAASDKLKAQENAMPSDRSRERGRRQPSGSPFLSSASANAKDATEKTSTEIRQEMILKKLSSPDYGRVLVGASQMVTAEIQLDYLIYQTDLIQDKR